MGRAVWVSSLDLSGAKLSHPEGTDTYQQQSCTAILLENTVDLLHKKTAAKETLTKS